MVKHKWKIEQMLGDELKASFWGVEVFRIQNISYKNKDSNPILETLNGTWNYDSSHEI